MIYFPLHKIQPGTVFKIDKETYYVCRVRRHSKKRGVVYGFILRDPIEHGDLGWYVNMFYGRPCRKWFVNVNTNLTFRSGALIFVEF